MNEMTSSSTSVKAKDVLTKKVVDTHLHHEPRELIESATFSIDYCTYYRISNDDNAI